MLVFSVALLALQVTAVSAGQALVGIRGIQDIQRQVPVLLGTQDSQGKVVIQGSVVRQVTRDSAVLGLAGLADIQVLESQVTRDIQVRE
jgi:hypothetical protein